MFHVALYQPEIPPNTGNIIRLCANTGSGLHLIHPLGFNLADKHVKRAGLDYHDLTHVLEHADYETFLAHIKTQRIFACSTKGKQRYTDIAYQRGDVLLFGSETKGLPANILQAFPQEHVLHIPMQANNRSLNLSNAVAVIVYEAWRQQGFGN